MSDNLFLYLLAGLLGGSVNAAAGGAKLFVFPMLLASGLPPIVANASSTVALWPGQLPAAWVYRNELMQNALNSYLRLLPALIGSLLGAIALIHSSNEAFSSAIPYLLMLSVAAIVFGPQLTRWSQQAQWVRQMPALTNALMLLCGFYGAYFGAGLGFMLLGVLSMSGIVDLQRANANKLLYAFLINTTAVLPLALSGLVHWWSASWVLLGAMAGGYVGAYISRLLPDWVLRSCVVLMGLVLIGHYLWAGR